MTAKFQLQSMLTILMQPAKLGQANEAMPYYEIVQGSCIGQAACDLNLTKWECNDFGSSRAKNITLNCSKPK